MLFIPDCHYSAICDSLGYYCKAFKAVSADWDVDTDKMNYY